MSAPPLSRLPESASDAFVLGAKTAATSVFVLVIVVTFIGFGALAHDYGLALPWAMLCTVLIWAAPAQVILTTALGVGTAWIEAALTVGLSSVRLLPMVVALLPLIKGERTRTWRLIVPVHFVAISVWIEAMRLGPVLQREHRVPFCIGIGALLMATGVAATAAGYALSAGLPALFGAAAMFITPMSFLVSTARNSKLLLEKAALVIGLAIAPVLAFSQVGLDLLWTGVIGGTLAYGVHRARAALA